MGKEFLVFVVVPFMVCFFSMPLIIAYSSWRDLLYYPTGDRWHREPTPFIGGVGIFFALLPFVVLYRNVAAVPFYFLFVAGLYDDIYIWTGAGKKFICQIIIAIMVVRYGYTFNWFGNNIADGIVTVIWIVGMCNAFNLIDNMDGFAGSIGTMSAVFFAITYPHTSTIMVPVIAVLAAFFAWNFPPAKIFMGDCGSLLIGFLFSIVTIEASRLYNGFSIYPFILLFFPLMDTFYVMVKRTLKRKPFWIGGKDHLSHWFAGSYRYAGAERSLVFWTYVHIIVCIIGFALAKGV